MLLSRGWAAAWLWPVVCWCWPEDSGSFSRASWYSLESLASSELSLLLSSEDVDSYLQGYFSILFHCTQHWLTSVRSGTVCGHSHGHATCSQAITCYFSISFDEGPGEPNRVGSGDIKQGPDWLTGFLTKGKAQ